MNARHLQIIAWLLVSFTALLALQAWGSTYNWRISFTDPYLLFPLLGLLAFSLMWSHYVMGAIRELAGLPRTALHKYFESTSFVVLVLLIAHPGLLILKRYLDGFGLPPGNYISYVAPGLGWLTLLGAASLVAFLLFELRRFYSDRSWWKYILLLNDAAMLAVFYHGLRLGSQLQGGWYRYVWLLYGLILVVIIARNNYKRYIVRTT